jgi:hypothetical protein
VITVKGQVGLDYIKRIARLTKDFYKKILANTCDKEKDKKNPKIQAYFLYFQCRVTKFKNFTMVPLPIEFFVISYKNSQNTP